MANPQLEGVRRYRKGRTLSDTLFGRTRYGKDNLTGEWVIIKESKRWHVENRVSIKGLKVAEDLGQEIAVHQSMMAFPDVSQHIVRLVDVCEDPNYIYVITEFCRGGDLFAFVRARHPLYQKPNQNENANSQSAPIIDTQSANAQWCMVVRKLFRQLVHGVTWMHSKRFCHRDLSLENVLLDENCIVKIIDFGVCKRYPARLENFETEAGFVGKTGYCAPEVYSLQPYDGRAADIWSIGVILFMLLTGAPAYQVPCQADLGFRMIFEGQLREMLEAWGRPIPDEALDLLSLIFTPEASRISSEELLTHPYVALEV